MMNFLTFSPTLLASILMAMTDATYSGDTTSKALLPKPFVHGHRGARARRPENTLAAFKYALQKEVDVLEMDLAVTSDDVLVVSHDPYINPDHCQFLSGAPAKEVIIRSLTLAEVKSYDCGSKKNPKFRDQIPVPREQIPTLEEVFSWIENESDPRAKTVQFNIEMKIDLSRPEYNAEPKVFAKLLADKIAEHQMGDRVIVQCFEAKGLSAMRDIAPSIRRSMLVDRSERNVWQKLKDSDAQILSPEFPLLSKKLVKALKDKNILIAPWTLNKESQWKKAVQYQVDAIITDDPEALIAYLKSPHHLDEIETAD